MYFWDFVCVIPNFARVPALFSFTLINTNNGKQIKENSTASIIVPTKAKANFLFEKLLLIRRKVMLCAKILAKEKPQIQFKMPDDVHSRNE